MTAPADTGGGGPIEVSGAAAHEAWRRRELPPIETLAGGVHSIPVPMTGHGMRYVLVYVIESPAGPVLVDSGWPDEIAWTALCVGLAEIGMAPDGIHGVLVTHAHSDHHGLSGRVRDASGCWIGMHPRDIELLEQVRSGHAARQRGTSFLDLVGAPEEERATLRELPNELRTSAQAIPDRRIEDGASELVPGRRISARWTPGHTPGHLVFVDEDRDRAFAGDHLLPRITPNVGSYALTGDPLGDYLSSLTIVESLPATTEILPAHEYRFRGVAGRTAAVREHHRVRLTEIADVVMTLGSATIWEVASGIEWSRGWSATTGRFRRLALAETLAHLRHLEATGLLRRDADSIPVRWRPTYGRNE